MVSRAEAAELSLACASQIRSSLASLKRDVALSFRICSRDFGVLGRELLTALAASRDRERVAALTLDHERTARRRAQAKAVELQGLVRVVCRVRPLLPHEASDSDDTTNASRSLTAVRVVSQQDIHVVVPTSSVSSSSSSSASNHGGDTSTKSFSCERVCGEDVSQQQLYREVQPLVAAAVEGQHACVFAYGQTGSGKTTTIHGTELDRGLVFRAAETIFDLVQEQRHVFDFNVTVQMVEIYNEEMYDLLGAEDNSSSPNGSSNAYSVVMPFQTSTNATHSPAFVSRRPLGEIRHGERGVYLRNVEAVAVHSAHDVLTVVQNGVVNRTVHSASGSDDHEHSSRSHCVIMIDVQRCSHMDGQVDGGRFVLVDLAGSERLLRTESSDSGQRIREAQHINKSLAAIGDVLSALLAKDKHVPYRNSKITHLLQESLGAADGQTLVLVHVSPTTADVTETVNTLKFAARVNRQQSATKRRSERQEVNRLQGTIATQAAQLQALQDKLASELELRRKYEKRLEEYRQDDHRRRAKDEDRGRLTPQSKQSQGTPTKTLGLGQQNSATPEQPYATRRWSLYARKEPLKPPSGSQTSRLQRGSAGGQENISENIMHTRSPAVPKMPAVAEKANSMAATPMRRARRLSMMMHSDRKALQSPQRAAAHPGLKRKAETPAQVRSILKKQRLSLQPEQLASPPDDLPVPGATSKQVSFDLTTRTAARVGGIQLLPPSLPATGSSSSALPPRQPTSLLRAPMAAGRVLAPPGRVAARAPTHTGIGSPKPRFRSSSLPTQGNKPKWNAAGWR